MITVKEPSDSYWNYIKKHPEFTGIVIDGKGNKHWYLNGKRHRKDGPACVWENGDKEWWLNGKMLTEQEWKIVMRKKKIGKLLEC